ncbi:mechanosensitive ion channel domain-containing protein [Maridesulfovibrio sp.]|uniref:mechanosensitive ion channel family protein n=1 Tax=Maridesulfovibrio sp. TaxID=2795000 RepID=UPI0029CA648F|nr:mechanosensitive ion channel domain-containing protein [Maridesulfovibrio sp.]
MDFQELFIFQDVELFVYIIGVTIVAFILYFWVNIRVSSYKEGRVSRIKGLVITDPETLSPMPTEIFTAKETKHQERKIIKGVRSRFTVIQRAFLYFVAIIWAFAVTMPFIGNVPSTMLSVIVATTTVIVGIAAKPFVENLICGIVISFSSQIRVGDTLIIDKQYGTVEDISITHTKIKTWDWKRYVIPNSRMLTKEFTNLNLDDSRLWSYLEFCVAFDSDMELVRDIAIEVSSQSEYATSSEDPQFWVMRMEKESIVCWIAAWAETPAEAWNLKSDMAIRLSKSLQEHNISTHLSKVDLCSRHDCAF